MKDLIQQLAKTDDEIYAKIGTVKEIDTSQGTAIVEPLDGTASIMQVYLQADEGGVYITPKVGSMVAVVFINKEMGVIGSHSEITDYQIKIENTFLQINKDGFLLKKENETLKALMSDLLKAIKAMKFTTNQGPTINLINRADFEALETRFNNLLK